MNIIAKIYITEGIEHLERYNCRYIFEKQKNENNIS